LTEEIDEACLVGVERELVPSKTPAQNVQNPLGILEVRKAPSGKTEVLAILRVSAKAVQF
jgi:hypothetical protein